jgi:hypothetical protein
VFALVVRAIVSATQLVRGLRVGEVSVCMPRFKSRNDSSGNVVVLIECRLLSLGIGVCHSCSSFR